MISYKEALRKLDRSKLSIKSETILSKDSLNRICSENVYSRFNYPAADNTAFDGFAINSNESNKASKYNTIKLKILKTLVAGDNPNIKKISKFSCIEVMTGTIIKKPFNTIIPYEKSKVITKNKIKYLLIDRKIKKFNNIRFAGSDFKKGQLVLKKGDIIKASNILVLKTLGIKNIKVKKKLKIVFFATGNEITNNEIIPHWKVRNSNGSYIKAFSKILPLDIKEKGILKDNDEKKFLIELNKNIKHKVDIVITIGAVSAGKYDYVPRIINKFKERGYFKGAKIRPGKPILFSKIKFGTAFFGLPGNPVSTAACFRFFVLPFIFNSLGYFDDVPIKAKLKNKFEKKKNITSFIKGKLVISKKGFSEFKVLKGQESYKIKPLANSNVWGQFNNGYSTFKKGDLINCHTTFGVNFF
jgi:molybdopterin molybdotransferase|tara:strand:- start:2583 stop:3824 length:1242 start_codon:yes stop_codon:yes gene_type:complete